MFPPVPTLIFAIASDAELPGAAVVSPLPSVLPPQAVQKTTAKTSISERTTANFFFIIYLLLCIPQLKASTRGNSINAIINHYGKYFKRFLHFDKIVPAFSA